ncbi:MAG: carboxymuconolactone decarboxylase family protein [Brevundimonas sp.]|uniref:carboxymuconolactone decarboxylase family protein n=1 Tax=Brevundimonas sp. TaxID=1871086 RepID=UPI0027376E85|nr:carboxymuconolactone decarboxylase family protein [Brevundimonas sp.]MDP3378496.1 carboxymuconolactone decarboxylase family protein [Brevundimonas sp.]
MTLNMHLKAISIAAALALGSAQATAQELSTPDDTYTDIEATYGVLPTFMKVYPRQGIAGAWALTKSLEVEKGALDPKVKSLINIAVAAQIPCRYCIWLDTKMARDLGATDEEIAEAVAQAGLTRHWSAILNGMQVDFETFKAEFGGD